MIVVMVVMCSYVYETQKVVRSVQIHVIVFISRPFKPANRLSNIINNFHSYNPGHLY